MPSAKVLYVEFGQGYIGTLADVYAGFGKMSTEPRGREMRPRPGHKTDPADARRIADLLPDGLTHPSFVRLPAL